MWALHVCCIGGNRPVELTLESSRSSAMYKNPRTDFKFDKTSITSWTKEMYKQGILESNFVLRRGAQKYTSLSLLRATPHVWCPHAWFARRDEAHDIASCFQTNRHLSDPWKVHG